MSKKIGIKRLQKELVENARLEGGGHSQNFVDGWIKGYAAGAEAGVKTALRELKKLRGIW